MCEKEVPGDETKFMTHLMGTGTGLLQSFKPLSNICQHVCGLHYYDGELQRQVIAHHYCSHLNEDVRQCVIYDAPEKKGRLIGVEYIISSKLFAQLPAEEKKYWHSHAYEVKSGLLVAPSVPGVAEYTEMKKLVDTYGKTWHMWQVDRGDELPYGEPKLMMALTKDGQANVSLLAEKDRVTGISTVQRRDQRLDIEAPPVLPGADQGCCGGMGGGGSTAI